MRIRQGTDVAHDGLRIGNANTQEQAGVKQVHLVVFDPNTGSERTERLSIGDLLRLGTTELRVVDISVRNGKVRGYVDLE